MGGTEALNEIAAYDSDIRRILNMEEAFVKTPELWVNYLIREREQSDWENYVRSREAKGEARGEIRGKAEGKAEGIAFVARRMLARGLSPDLIAEDTGLSLEEVRALQSQAGPT